jgi:hypothetical protein
LPFVALGGLLAVVCVLAYAYGAVRLGDRVQVLAVARPVAAGHTFTEADLTVVAAARDPNVALIPASRSSEVLGHAAVVPLVAGSLLTPTQVGDAAFPPAGKVVTSLALKPGQYPQGLTAGSSVAVFVSADQTTTGQTSITGGGVTTGSGAAQPVRVNAVVLGVDLNGDGQGSSVLTFLLESGDAVRLASASAGRVLVMQTSGQGS